MLSSSSSELFPFRDKLICQFKERWLLIPVWAKTIILCFEAHVTGNKCLLAWCNDLNPCPACSLTLALQDWSQDCPSLQDLTSSNTLSLIGPRICSEFHIAVVLSISMVPTEITVSEIWSNYSYTRPAEFAKAWRYHSLLLLSFEWSWAGEHQSWKMPSSWPWWRRDTFLLGFHSNRNARSTLWNASLGDISSLNLLLTSSCCHQEAHITAPCTGSDCKFFIICAD